MAENIDILLTEVRNTKNVSSVTNDYILKLEDDLRQYVEKIKEFDSAEAAEETLIQLGHFQTKLAELTFKCRLPLSEKLNVVVHHFDRADDPDARRFFFKMIKTQF